MSAYFFAEDVPFCECTFMRREVLRGLLGRLFLGGNIQ